MAINQISSNIYPAPYNHSFGASKNASPTPQVSKTGQAEHTPKNQNTTFPADNREPKPLSKTTSAASSSTVTLTRAERLLLAELKKTDTQVRQHEMAHVTAGGGVVTSGARFVYKRGPDGRNYAVAGEVSIDASPVPGDPRATIQKMQQVKTAALAPANPSAQDLKVASRATVLAAKAASELMILQAREQASANESRAFGSMENAAGSYIKVNGLPETDTHTFTLSV
jgi:hypothetical protein